MKNKINTSEKVNIKNSILFKMHLLLVLLPCLAAAQSEISSQKFTDMANYDHQPCITKEMHAEMKNRTLKNLADLKERGILHVSGQKTASVTQTFAWPLTYNSNFYDNDYYYIQNYIDHDVTTGSVLDYNCGSRTYDKPDGYDHTGTDICIGPYFWSMMDSMFVHVIAAAPGQIVDKDDGNYDRNCSFGGGGGDPNFVKIMHTDGSFAIYYHMKTGSVTGKIIGDMVKEGEYLGIVGSSGSSTNPHLHFEVQDQSGNVVDPWVGSCNPTVSTSLWKNQLPYYNPGILRLMTLSGPVGLSNCPDPEPLTIKNHFNPLEIARFEVHLRDLVPGLIANLVVTDPAGNNFVNQILTNSGSFSPMGYYYISAVLPNINGTYKMSVTYGGKSAVHYFTVGCPGSLSFTASQSGKKGYLSGGHINSTSVINGSSTTKVWYEAESYIRMNPGFTATSGCTFTARLNNCTIGGVRESENTNQKLSFQPTLVPVPSIADQESTLEINLPADDFITLYIYDLTGRKIQTPVTAKSLPAGSHQIPCTTSSFSNGLYTIKMTGRNTETSARLIVQH